VSALGLGQYGVFVRGAPSAQEAAQIEALGYGAVWVAGSPPADLAWAEPLLEATTILRLGTAIINIWTADPTEVAASYHRIERAHPGRFVIGIGAGHPELHQEYRKPLEALRDYLDRLDELAVPVDRRALAAQGPKALELAAARTAGAIPYLTTRDHTAQARKILGSGALLAPEHMVVLSTDPGHARAAGREAFATSIQKANYQASWRRIGFTDDDLAGGGSDRLVDAVVSFGSPSDVAAALKEFIAAGADHVSIQVLSTRPRLLSSLAQLAAAL
jgi:probable F420-dependent oxidoreductase